MSEFENIINGRDLNDGSLSSSRSSLSNMSDSFEIFELADLKDTVLNKMNQSMN